MPFTGIHGLLALVPAWFLAKNRRLALVAFIAGMLPDLDGLPLFFDMNLYYQVHHELFHAPIYGVLLAVPVALILGKYWKLDRKITAVVFAGSFALHSVTDVFFTSWPVKLFWPLTNQEFSYPILREYNWLLSIAVLVAAVFCARSLLIQSRKGKKPQ